MSDFEKQLRELLDFAYDKGQAYYRFDFYGSREDEDQEWEYCYEEEYQKKIKDFIGDYIQWGRHDG